MSRREYLVLIIVIFVESLAAHNLLINPTNQYGYVCVLLCVIVYFNIITWSIVHA